MAAVLPPLIAAGSFGLYFLTSLRLARYRRVPWEFLAAIAACAGLGVYLWWRAPGIGTAVGALLSVGILAFACWFLFSFTMYGPREDRPRVGDVFPTFRLPASDGSLYDSIAGNGKPRLLIFYRGSW
jgi:hypothetical protein